MKAILEKTYKDKRVLVTGHTGFKGSWLSLWLTELGAKVTGYALDPYTDQDNFVTSGLTDEMIDIRGDVRDYEKLTRVFKKHKPELVFHLAAQPIVRVSYLNPKETLDVNIGGTVNVLECCKNTESVRTIINVTSDKCYENREIPRSYRETDPMGGYDPYSASKGCSELITSSYRRSFFNPEKITEHGKALSSVRAGNVIGGGDWAKDRILPDCIRSLMKGEKIFVRNPESTRPWQHVLEPLSGYLLLAAKMTEDPVTFSGAWNFGPELSSVISVQSVVQSVIQNWGTGEWYSEKRDNEPHEAKLLALNISKAKKHLNWTPRYNTEKAIKETVRWYRENRDGSDMYQICVDQINEYLGQ